MRMPRKRRRWIWVILLVLVAAALLWRHRGTAPTVKDGSFLLIALEGQYAEEPPSDIFRRLFRAPQRSLIDVLETLLVARADKRIAGAIVRVRPLDVGWAKAQDIRDGVAAFRAAGKPVYAVIEHEGSVSNLGYFVASAADRVYLTPAAIAPLVGLAGQWFYLGGVWEKLDIEMHVEKIAEYKTAGDMLVNREMSPYEREMNNAILDSINRTFLAAVAEARGLDPAKVQELIDRGLSTAAEFEAAGLGDGAKYAADVRREDAGDAPVVEFDDYAGVDPESVGLEAAATIAVVYGVGPIAMGDGESGAFDGPVMSPAVAVKALEEAADNDAAKAIIFRIDSPGGSALASDLIWRATQEARAKKPVIVSMSDVAGSGGYYVACGANAIVAQPATLTGSIGVVFARPNLTGLLNRFGVTTETLTRGTYARINDLTAPYDDATQAKLIEQMESVYEQFVARVALGRKLPAERVKEVGRGRVWTGEQALANGLVDDTGGFAAAVRAAKLAAGLRDTDEVTLVYYPRRKPFAERIVEALTARVARDAVPAPVRQWAAALPLHPFTDPGVLALMRERVVIR